MGSNRRRRALVSAVDRALFTILTSRNTIQYTVQQQLTWHTPLIYSFIIVIIIIIIIAQP